MAEEPAGLHVFWTVLIDPDHRNQKQTNKQVTEKLLADLAWINTHLI
jgi:hypothetical protein